MFVSLKMILFGPLSVLERKRESTTTKFQRIVTNLLWNKAIFLDVESH